MNEITKLLEEKLENYEAADRNARRYLKENREELTKDADYARLLKLPVKENQMFFFFGKDLTGKEVRLLLLLYEHFKCSPERNYVFVSFGKQLGDEAVMTEKNSEEYWDAFARSKYLFAVGRLPAFFVKRREQVYFNALKEAAASLSGTAERLSRLYREFLKTDFTLGEDESSAREIWERQAGLLKWYRGKILLCGEPENAVPAIGDAVLAAGEGREVRASGPMGVLSPEKTGRKKVLVLTTWKASREQKYVIRTILGQPELSRCDVTVLSPYTGESWLLEDFAALDARFTKLLYREHFPMTEEEAHSWYLLERNPDIRSDSDAVRAFLDSLMEREWGQIWGASFSFDVCLVLGARGSQSCYLALAGAFRRRILVDLDYLPAFRTKSLSGWQKAISAFDGIYTLPAAKPAVYGSGNQSRLQPITLELPDENPLVLPSPLPQVTVGEALEYGGRQYRVSDCWREKDGYCIRLIEYCRRR